MNQSPNRPVRTRADNQQIERCAIARQDLDGRPVHGVRRDPAKDGDPLASVVQERVDCVSKRQRPGSEPRQWNRDGGARRELSGVGRG